jgi:hypothetical protein
MSAFYISKFGILTFDTSTTVTLTFQLVINWRRAAARFFRPIFFRVSKPQICENPRYDSSIAAAAAADFAVINEPV